MTSEILMMVILSAVLHPLWNLLMKRDAHPERAYIILMVGSGLFALAHAVISGADLWAAREVWTLLAISIAGQMLYGSCLVQAYKHGDLSIYYPIIRASPLFIVAVQFTVFGQRYDWTVLLGIVLVLGAAAVLAAKPGRYFHYEAKPLIFAVLAMCGTGIYSLSDGAAMQFIEAPVLFFWVQMGGVVLFVGLFGITGRVRLTDFTHRRHRGTLIRGLLASCIVYGSYFFILKAYALGGDVALVTTVRQISIPLSVLMGALMLRETGLARRFAASGVLGIGIAIALGG